MLALATVGFAVNFWAWALLSPLGPHLKDSLHLSTVQQSLVVAVPVVVGSLGRIPVGALTDRFGGRVMFPLVSACTIAPVLFLGLAGHSSLAALLTGGLFLGIGGTAFAVGVPPSPAPAAAAGARSGCPTSRAAGLPPPWAYRQSAVRSRSSSSGRRRYSIISRTDARASRVSAKHCSADVQRTGANPCASSTTGCARPASSAASSESIGHGFPVAAAPELATCS